MFFKKEKSKQQEKGDFYLGVQKIFRIENSADLLAAGKVNGTIYKGAAIYITNPGEDSKLTELTTVTEIIINNNSVDNAADTFVIVKLEAAGIITLHRHLEVSRARPDKFFFLFSFHNTEGLSQWQPFWFPQLVTVHT